MLGLTTLADSKCFYFSATYDKYCKEAMKNAFLGNHQYLKYNGPITAAEGEKKKSYELNITVTEQG